jgi:hypothetical protein
VLAAIGQAGLEPQIVARWLNVLSLAFIVFIASRWLLARLRNRALAVLAGAGVLFGVPLLSNAMNALSETLFTLILLLVLINLEAFSESRASSRLFIAGFFAGLACLTRHLGLTAVLSGAAYLLLMPGTSLRLRIRASGIFTLLALAVLSPWIVRNVLLSGHPVASWQRPAATVLGSLADLVGAISGWYLPAKVPHAARISMTGMLLVACFTMYLYERVWLRSKTQPVEYRPVIFELFAVAYLASLVILTTAFVNVDQIGQRYMGPVFLPVVFSVFCLLDRLDRAPALAKTARVARPLLTGALMLWLVFACRSGVGLVRYCLTEGPGAFGASWRNSELLQYIENRTFNGPAFTNQPSAVYLLAGRVLRESPFKRPYRSAELLPEVSPLANAVERGESVELVWFHDSMTDGMLTLEELGERFTLVELRGFADGGLYEVQWARSLP